MDLLSGFLLELQIANDDKREKKQIKASKVLLRFRYIPANSFTPSMIPNYNITLLSTYL